MRKLIQYLAKDMNPVVFLISGVMVLTFVIFGATQPALAGDWFSKAQQWIVDTFGWFYILSVGGFLIFTIWLMLSPFGDIRLGKDDEEPEYKNISWFAMLFSAGMGIGLLFWGVAEPILHFLGDRSGDPESVKAARHAITTTFFHWGLHAWAIYIVMGMSLAYFGYRHNLPLTIRSTLYPLLGRHIHGPIGWIVEILAVFGTLFGVATSLGLGVVQINAGLNYLGWLPEGQTTQVILITVITFCATLSVVSGLDAGIRRLSEMNLFLSVILVVFVFIAGPTMFLLSAFVSGIGNYISSLIEMTFTTDAYQGTEWQSYWTMFYWGWWISWSPFVGMFIARISRGRTIRGFIFGTLFVPTLLTFIWLTIFGGAALHMELNPDSYGVDAVGVAEMVKENAPVGLFAMLGNLPLSGVMTVLSIMVIATYFVTSSDSASLVVDMLTSGGNPNPPIWSRVFWALLEGAVAAVLLSAGYAAMRATERGDFSATEALNALQDAAIITALPFCAVLIAICVSLVRGLNAERRGQQSALPVETMELAEVMEADEAENVSFREKLNHVLGRVDSQREKDEAREKAGRFIEQTVLPAFREIQKELERHGRKVAVQRHGYQATLVIMRDDLEEFCYTVRARVFRKAVAAFPELEDGKVPRSVRGEIVIRGGLPRTYDLSHFSREGVLEDFLHEYAKWVGW